MFSAKDFTTVYGECCTIENTWGIQSLCFLWRLNALPKPTSDICSVGHEGCCIACQLTCDMFRSKFLLRLYLASLCGFCVAEMISFLRSIFVLVSKILHCFQISSSHRGGYFSQASESQACRIKAWKNLLEEGCEQLQASLSVVCFCFLLMNLSPVPVIVI